MNEGAAGQGSIEPVGSKVRIVAEVCGEPSFDAHGDIVLMPVGSPVAVSVSDKSVRDNDDIVIVHNRLACLAVDRIDDALVRAKGETSDRWRKAIGPVALPKVRRQVKPVLVVYRMFKVHNGRVLCKPGRVPHDAAVCETTPPVAIMGAARRVGERTGITVCRVAVAQCTRPQARDLPFVNLVDPDGVAADTDVPGLAERTTWLPDRSAVFSA